MKPVFKFVLLFVLGSFLIGTTAWSQSSVLSGTVKNSKSKEGLSAISVMVKGGTAGTYTDDRGNFKFSTVQKFPVTLVFSSIGFSSKEVVVNSSNQTLDVELAASYTLGEEVVVAASRVPERILESPVSIERIGTTAIRNTPAANYYDMLTNLKGVDVVAASLTFRSVGTRGFNSSGNIRLNQLIDGMDNQAPGLNFSVGSVIGLTELDVESMELLQGASSALYGSGGMNGTVLLNSKNPFKYQGFSFQIKQGVNHVDGYQRPRSPYFDWSFRWAKKVSEKFAFKFSGQFIQAQDWLANQTNNYSRAASSSYPNGRTISGYRLNDPNYDGVNVYGDETTSSLGAVRDGVFAGLRAAFGVPTFNALYAASNAFLNASPNATINDYNFWLTQNGFAQLVASGTTPFFYGDNRKYFDGVNVSRTGYNENQILDPTTLNVKMTGGLYYKLSANTEASVQAYWGTGNTVYTGSDRYSLVNLVMGQYKFELKNKNWFLRYYFTRENSGNSYNATITTRLFNEAWKPSSTWYQQYAASFAASRSFGANNFDAHNSARGFADQGRPTGFIGNNPLFQQVANTPISQGGGLFLDRSKLRVFEGQYNFSNDLGLNKTGTDFLIGFSSRQFLLDSKGTLFADTAAKIKINEFGMYAQLSQKMFGDFLKITASGRYDKNTNFEGRFTPRVSAVVKLATDHNLRFSYQQAYRFPTTQNQWINLLIGGGTRLMGGLPTLRDYYNFSGNPAYTVASVQAFGGSVLAGAPNPALLQQQVFPDFKPESMKSNEIGYKGLIANRLLIDAYYYWATYKDFISGVQVLQARTPGNAFDLLDASKRIGYSISTNTPGDVNTSGWGVSLDYLLGRNLTFTANLYSDKIGVLPLGFVSYFNTPLYRTNIALNNTGFGKQNRWGYNVVYRWVDSFTYEGTFAVGDMPSYGTFDASISYKLLSSKSLIKVGGTNIFNRYYRTGFGNPQIGGLYYISFGWNVF
ncbi:MAG: TonB-dependent receptor [Chitinophagia bacterium]|jgi:outer membrane receptor protein involved in Fe transport